MVAAKPFLRGLGGMGWDEAFRGDGARVGAGRAGQGGM